ncbi:hypothetical protein Glove_221g46 [Diversispora epigaea]|uniref:Uncharacterized protein n=1 Tax=Diversispora epigaea TaxID=1348612 RepID=A0A397IFK4_9GLOM|nr:hypothetical protein Glove_221g46 [Diversispora epigaea]
MHVDVVVMLGLAGVAVEKIKIENRSVYLKITIKIDNDDDEKRKRHNFAYSEALETLGRHKVKIDKTDILLSEYLDDPYVNQYEKELLINEKINF